mgnify:CR=1 FL=1
MNKKNQGGTLVDTYDLSLEQGVKDYDTYPGLVILPRHLGGINEPIVVPNRETTIRGVPGSYFAASTVQSVNKIVTFPDKTHYSCYEATTNKDGELMIVFNADAEKKSLNGDAASGALIDCSGVQFRILNYNAVVDKTIAESIAWLKYEGTALHVTYTRASGATSTCNSASQDWTTEITLYNGVCENSPNCQTASNWRMSRTPVYVEGKIQKKSITYKVACRSFNLAEGEAQPIQVQRFEISPATVKQGSEITVTWDIRAPPNGITSLNLSLESSGPEIDLDSIDVSGSKKVKITASVKEYDVKLVVNGNPSSIFVRKLSVEKS